MLNSLPRNRWEYFLSECLPGDLQILGKLSFAKPLAQWIDLVRDYKLADYQITNEKAKRLVQASKLEQRDIVIRLAQELIMDLGYQAR